MPAERSRKIVLGIALIGTVVAAVYPVEEPPAQQPMAKNRTGQLAAVKSPEAPDENIPWIEIVRAPIAAPENNPFSDNAWRPPPPPPPKPEAPPAPMAPPFPYSYAGRMGSEEKPLLLFVSNDKSVSARVGELIDSAWRVEAVDETSISLRYLPLDQTQSISLGSPS